MKQVVQHVRSRELEVAEVPAPGCRPGGILVQNAASLLSAGTERMVTEFAGKSLLGKARERPDLVKQVLDKVKRDGVLPTARTVLTRLDQPIPLGYSCAGRVLEVGAGVEEFAAGDVVACAGMGYASHADVVYVPRNLAVAVPASVSPEDAAYVTVGAIALHGVRVTDVRLGETVSVIGLGLLGQLAAQILKAAGARVVGIDLDPSKVALARDLGIDVALLRSDDVPGAVSSFTGGVGVDAVLITAAADSNDPTELAGVIARDRAVVTMVGAVRMDIPRKLYYEKELQFRLSRSYGPGRYDPAYEEKGNDYPIGYVRWTERRNMEEFIRLVAAGAVTPARLTTHRFSIDRAKEAYALIGGSTGESFAGVVITYPETRMPAVTRTIPLTARPARPGRVGTGFIGAGNFARAILLPAFAKHPDVDLVSVTAASGATAKTTGDKYGFRYCGTDSAALLAEPSIDAVVIATRHGSHAKYAADALRAGKAAFVEKPLALNETQLCAVLDAQRETNGIVAVGFNRRFSSLATMLRESTRDWGPLAINYRINAGPIPPTNWVHDAAEGGGRIIGEVCHFVDVLQFLTGEDPTEVFAAKLGGPAGATGDTVTITLRFSNGSLASIAYFATGDKSFSKERIEVYGGGGIAVLDDWRSLVISRDGKKQAKKLLAQDKGYEAEVAAFISAVRSRIPPIPISSLAATSRATYAAVQSLHDGRVISLDASGE
jgi:predicted dehydrogenase/threonine dehydrogenase-like Zn-dependent dehydrogenase